MDHLFFKLIKALHKFELKNLMAKISVPTAIVLRKLIIFESLVFKYYFLTKDNEMASNKKKKASRRNTKDLRQSR